MVVKAGSAILVGAGVPHAVVNDEDSIAYSVSFINSSNIVAALQTAGGDSRYFRHMLEKDGRISYGYASRSTSCRISPVFVGSS